MDRGARRATVHGVAESDMNEYTLLYYYPYKQPPPSVTQALSKYACNNIP